MNMQTGTSLAEVIQQQLESGNAELPVFNPIAQRIQKETAGSEPNFQLIEQLIVKDTALASEVLKMANCPVYRGLTEVTSIRSAIVRLGAKEVANIVTLVTHENHFQSKDPFIHKTMRRLWSHSLGCAVGAQSLAKKSGLPEMAQEAFLAALLHDIGKLLIIKIINDVMGSKQMNIHLTEALLIDALDRLHGKCGYSLMVQWNLPDKYTEVASNHHKEGYDGKNLLLVIVRLVNKACRKIGLGLHHDSTLSLTATAEFQLLNLNDIDMAELELKLEDIKALNENK
jgi:HD-like signal output (HDOD) protein